MKHLEESENEETEEDEEEKVVHHYEQFGRPMISFLLLLRFIKCFELRHCTNGSRDFNGTKIWGSGSGLWVWASLFIFVLVMVFCF